MKTHLIFVIIINFFISSNVFSNGENNPFYSVEDAYYWNNKTINFNEKLHKELNPKSNIYLPLLETLTLNLVIGGYNKYIAESDFAQIDFSSIKNNFKTGFQLDTDDLYTNFMRHPFQGAMYYNTARTNGYNYYESLLVSLFGSLQWEFFMEIEPPSINDVILTTFAGAMLGEAFYRLSNFIIDESSSGFERVVREGGISLFNPARTLNRGIRGRLTRYTYQNMYLKEKYFINFKIGASNLNRLENYPRKKPRLYLKFEINYNNPFLKAKLKPFDYFHIKSEVNPAQTNVQETLLTVKKTNLFGTFRVFSVLYGKRYKKSKNFELVWGIFQNFDFLQNDIYQVGSLDLSTGFLLKRISKRGTLLFAGLTIGAVPMSGIDSPYSKYFLVKSLNESRNYNLSRGFTSNMHIELHIPYISFKLHSTYWLLHSYHGASGMELLGIVEPSIHFNLLKRLSIGLESTIYHRKAKHDDFPDLNEVNRNYKVFIEFKI